MSNLRERLESCWLRAHPDFIPEPGDLHDRIINEAVEAMDDEDNPTRGMVALRDDIQRFIDEIEEEWEVKS